MVILSLLCCWPLGLVLVWVNKQWTAKTKWIVTGVIIVLGLLGAIAVAAGGGSSTDDALKVTSQSSTTTTEAEASDDGEPTTTTTTEAAPVEAVACNATPADEDLDTQTTALFPGRPNAQGSDHEAAIGDCVRMNGLTTYVTSASIVDSSNQFIDPQLVIEVKIENRDPRAKPFNLFDWQLQTPGGQVVDPTIYLGDGALRSGDLIPGGSVSGKIAFDAAEPGTYYLIFKPNPLDDARGIWEATV